MDYSKLIDAITETVDDNAEGLSWREKAEVIKKAFGENISSLEEFISWFEEDGEGEMALVE